jgi:hypothetical protein
MRSVLFLVVMFISQVSPAQEKNLLYQVIRNGNKIGHLSLHESRAGDVIKFKLLSEIKTRVIFTITASGSEEAEFEKGILRSSSFTQTVNGKEKVNKKTFNKGTHYTVNNNGKETRINYSTIAYNMVCLYTIEPINKTLVYSDKHSAFLSVTKIKEHHYRIKFPDGNFNEYTYEKGTCKSIKVESTLYSITMELL